MKRYKRCLIEFLRGLRKDLKRWTHGLQRFSANFLNEYRNKNRMCSNPPQGWDVDQILMYDLSLSTCVLI